MDAPALPAREIVNSMGRFKGDDASFQTHVHIALAQALDYWELVYTDVPVESGRRIVDTLGDSAEGIDHKKHYNSVTKTFWIRVQPEEVHSCQNRWFDDQVNRWIDTGLITSQEKTFIHPGSEQTFHFPDGQYAGSAKDPDFFLRIGRQRYPNLVIETGWRECWNRLSDDLMIWSDEEVGAEAVLLLKWEKVDYSSIVKGVAELYGFKANDDGTRVPELKQSEIIFPAPGLDERAQQQIRLSRRAIFGDGPYLDSGQSPEDIFPMDIDGLRRAARQSLAVNRLIPA